MKPIKLLIMACTLAITYSYTAQAYQIGDRGMAPWRGAMYPAEIQKMKDGQCFIHWTKENGTYDEWMDCAKFVANGSLPQFSEGEPVLVEWKGSWWPAHVIAVKPNAWKIHYDSYDSSWDEWVAGNRIRKK